MYLQSNWKVNDEFISNGTKLIPKPVHVLVSISGGYSSLFLWDLFQKRLQPSLNGKTAVVRKLEAISDQDLENFEFNYPYHKITKFSIQNVIKFAKENDFNCVVFGDNVDHVTLLNIASLSCGRPDLEHWYSVDDFTNYRPISVLRPVRESLSCEIQFYCVKNNIKFDKAISVFEKAFKHELKMIQDVVNDDNGCVPFAVLKFAEKLPSFEYKFNCSNCGLPAPEEGICSFCATIQSFE